jgi:hypothetical protein
VTAGASGWQVSIAPAPGQSGAYQVYDQNQNLLATVQGNASPYQWTLNQTGDPYFMGQIVGYVSVPSGTMNMLVTDTGTQAVSVPQSGGAFGSAGAITQKSGRAFLTGGSATAYTITAPTPGADDFKLLEIADATGHAHTITGPVNCFNGVSNIATYNGTAGSVLALRAWQGVWYVNAGTTVVLSGT